MTHQDLTHIDDRGRASMVDVGGKPIVRRTAIADGFLVAKPESLDRLMNGDLPKGEGLAVARVAGIQAAKRCAETIPLCHTLPLDSVNIDFERAAPDRLQVVATVHTTARTGVEMEALLATSTAILATWDMLKAIDSDLLVESIALREKTKGSV
ncbi:MAG: cyclic pyranopterin monophosphate synthase MoaC [Phycisphaerales bacterium]|nr:cyclic pyranopterin monophosphate synthase MoaC [Phycisphaerales bacterium]